MLGDGGEPVRPGGRDAARVPLTQVVSQQIDGTLMTPRLRPIACETKFARLDFKQVAADGVFEGYASVFGIEDMGRDIVLPGAFRESLRRRGPSGIKLLFQHDPAEPIGVWLSIVEDRKGLFVRGRLMAEVARAREVLALMRAGALDGLSIGYRTVRARRDAKTGVRKLQAVDLWEISVVTFPLHPEARVLRIAPTGKRGARRLASGQAFERRCARTGDPPRLRLRQVRAPCPGQRGAGWEAAGGLARSRLALRMRRAAARLRKDGLVNDGKR